MQYEPEEPLATLYRYYCIALLVAFAVALFRLVL